MIDGGLPLPDVRALLGSAAATVDVWKLGWGSAYLDASLDAKLAVLRRHDVVGLPRRDAAGGRRVPAPVRGVPEWMAASGFTQIEVSDGLGLLGEDAKTALIRRAASTFTVVSEVGPKQPTPSCRQRPGSNWPTPISTSGAAAVIAEGRESGTVGMYAEDGSAQADVVDALLDGVGADRLIFEAPRKDQQAWLIGYVGTEVNLANVAPREALGLEAFRLGLRADTTLAVHAPAPVPR